MKKRKVQKEQKIREKGITLIALIITIIVLLILAGVALSSLFGDNGILNNAESAKNQTSLANAKEKVQVAIMEYKIGQYSEGKTLKEYLEAAGATEVTEAGTKGKIDGYNFAIENGVVTISKEEAAAATVYTDAKYFEFECDEDAGTAKLIGIKEIYQPKYTFVSEIEMEEYEDFSAPTYIYDEQNGIEITEISIPYSVESENGIECVITEIASQAFGVFEDLIWFGNVDKTISKIEIPAGVTTIGNYAFGSQIGIEEIVIPSSVSSIGNNAFKYCSALKTINIEKEENSITGSPWGATSATVVWNYLNEENN